LNRVCMRAFIEMNTCVSWMRVLVCQIGCHCCSVVGRWCGVVCFIKKYFNFMYYYISLPYLTLLLLLLFLLRCVFTMTSGASFPFDAVYIHHSSVYLKTCHRRSGHNGIAVRHNLRRSSILSSFSCIGRKSLRR